MPCLSPLLLAIALPAVAQPRLLGLTSEGGDFRADLPDGTHLRGAMPMCRRPPFCAPDPQNKSLAMSCPAEDGRLRLTCSSGAIGKCIRLGYRPWARLPDVASLAPFHAACTHTVRAACVARARVPENGAPADVVATHSQLAGVAGPEMCSEDRAQAFSVLVFNRSARQ